MDTFTSYLREPRSLTIEKMQELHEELILEIDSDPDAVELYADLIEAATKYASIRASWLQMTNGQKMETDPFRTSCHNTVISCFDVLARYLHTLGKKAAWRDQLGYEKDDKYFRKSIGDFACYLVFINSICAR